MLSSIRHNSVEVLKGLLFSYQITQAARIEQEVKKGNSPNRLELISTRILQAITQWFPLTYLANNLQQQDEQALERHFKTSLGVFNYLIGLANLALLLVFEAFYFGVQQISQGNIFQRSLALTCNIARNSMGDFLLPLKHYLEKKIHPKVGQVLSPFIFLCQKVDSAMVRTANGAERLLIPFCQKIDGFLAIFSRGAKKWLLPLCQSIDNHIGKLIYLSSVLLMASFFLTNSWYLPLGYFSSNLVFYIQSKNLYSPRIRTHIDWVLYWTASVTGVLFGNNIEKILFGFVIIQRTSRILEKITSLAIKGLHRISKNWLLASWEKSLAIWADRLHPQKVSSFQFQSNPRQFFKTIENLAQSPRLRVSKAYVQERKDLLPLVFEETDNSQLLALFFDPELAQQWERSHERILKAITEDWQLSSEVLDCGKESLQRLFSTNPNYARKEMNFLYEGLETYINQIQNGNLPGTAPGSEFKLKLYLNSITTHIQRLHAAKKYDLVIKALIMMGIEGGTNCSIGKSRVLQDVYRMLLVEDDTGFYPPAARIAAILELDRELHFQCYTENPRFLIDWLICKLNRIYWQKQDTHGYNVLVASLAPRLGLPCLSAQVDLNAQSDYDNFIPSLRSACEQSYWEKMTPQMTADVIQTAILGSHQFKASDILSWFQDFLERFGIGSAAQQRRLFNSSTQLDAKHPLITYVGNNIMMNNDLLALMLLDMGVLYLEGENSLGRAVKKTPNRAYDLRSRVNNLDTAANECAVQAAYTPARHTAGSRSLQATAPSSSLQAENQQKFRLK